MLQEKPLKIQEGQVRRENPGRALKGTWLVTAGLIPGELVDEYTRLYQYSSTDYDLDDQMREPEDGVTIFRKLTHEAYQYALSLSDPSVANWVKLKWIWY